MARRISRLNLLVSSLEGLASNAFNQKEYSVMIEVTKEQIEALRKEAFDLENQADSLRQNLIDLQWTINALLHPEEEAE